MKPEEYEEYIELLDSLFEEQGGNKKVIDAFMTVWLTMNKEMYKLQGDEFIEMDAKTMRYCIDKFADTWVD